MVLGDKYSEPKPIEDEVVKNELESVVKKDRPARINFCIKRFIFWRKAGYSPHEMQIMYQLSINDMYKKVIKTVEDQTGISRNKLLKYPGCGCGRRTVVRKVESKNQPESPKNPEEEKMMENSMNQSLNTPSTSVTIPIRKACELADRGESSDRAAEILGITAEQLFDALDSFGERRPKLAGQIAKRFRHNDEFHKKRLRRIEEAQAAKASAPNTAKQPEVEVEVENKTETETKAETGTTTDVKIQRIISSKMSPEAFAIDEEIKQIENDLVRIDAEEAETKMTIEEDKKSLSVIVAELKELTEKLKSLRDDCESKKVAIKNAENALIAFEGQRAANRSQLAELKKQFDAVSKPEIYICSDGEIQTENINVPDHIDVSGWAELISMLPEEIGDELRKKDAEVLIRLRVILNGINRKDVEICFEDSMLQKAFEIITKSC